MTAEGHDRTFAGLWRLLSFRFSRYLDRKTRDIDHQNVMTELAGRTEMSGNYFSSLILANLIALLGLMTNSIAVIIGAMLISPLMGPIFSLGLAFAMGDLALSRRAVKNIGYSVLLTISVAALFTLLSPLNGVTHEILSRTRPNIYDLLIAGFSGTAGALALCTRKNYLFTTTGVAVATAVIPPLSVVGYGMGTWQLSMAMGGFLLFFTNLVAIVISSNVVFYVLRFRGSMVEETNYTLRRRFQILGTVLVLISIPLIITLVTDLRKAKLAGHIEKLLKTDLNRQQQSRVTTVSIDQKDGKIIVSASINTVKYVDSVVVKKIETDLTSHIGKPVNMELEQVIVRSGAVDPPTPLRTEIRAVVPQPPDTLATLREKSIAKINEGCREIEAFIAPYKIRTCRVSFSDQNKAVGVMITIGRDYPPNPQELQWLDTVLEKKLMEPIELKVDTAPFLPPVTFTDNDEMDESSRKTLEQLKQILIKQPSSRLTIEIPAGRRNDKHRNQRISLLKEYLVKELGLPADHITVKRNSDKLTRVTVQI